LKSEDLVRNELRIKKLVEQLYPTNQPLGKIHVVYTLGFSTVRPFSITSTQIETILEKDLLNESEGEYHWLKSY
jgi:hypothetical protein